MGNGVATPPSSSNSGEPCVSSACNPVRYGRVPLHMHVMRYIHLISRGRERALKGTLHPSGAVLLWVQIGSVGRSIT